MILEGTSYIRPASLHIAVRDDELAIAAAVGADSSSLAVGDMSLLEQERRLVFQATAKNRWQALAGRSLIADYSRYVALQNQEVQPAE